MKHRAVLLLGCVLAASLVLGHRHHGGGEGGAGDWEQRPSGGWRQQGGGGGDWGQRPVGGWGQQGGGGWGRHHGGGRGHHGHHGHHGGHHRGNRGHHCPFVNFQVKVPQGLEVSMVQKNPNVTMFGIELNVNRAAGNGSTCDVCHNTTTITYGKFIIEDSEAIIKKGDVLSYIVIVEDGTNVTRHGPQRLYVTDSIIDKCNCEGTQVNQDPDIDLRFTPSERPETRPGVSTGISEEPSDPTEETFEFEEVQRAHINEQFSQEDVPPYESKVASADLTTKDWHREVQILEDIIEQMKTGCGSKRASNRILLKQSPHRPNDAQELLNFVRSSLAVNAEMQELASGIRGVKTAAPALGKAVVFDMESYADKQRVLYHARLNNLVQVVDYDQASRRY